MPGDPLSYRKHFPWPPIGRGVGAPRPPLKDFAVQNLIRPY